MSTPGEPSAFWVLVIMHWRMARRDTVTLFFTFAFPLLFLVLFGLVFREQEVAGTDRSYIHYVAPGVLTWGVANAAVFSVAFALQHWRQSDLLRILQLTPTRLSTLLGSKLVVVLATAAGQAALFVAVATVPFFGLRPAATSWQLIPLLGAGVATFSCLGAIIGSLASSTEAIAAASNAVMLPMAFLSGAFFPLDLMPEGLRTAAKALPLFHLNAPVGHALAGSAALVDAALNGAILLGFGIVFAVVARRVFRWSDD